MDMINMPLLQIQYIKWCRQDFLMSWAYRVFLSYLSSHSENTKREQQNQLDLNHNNNKHAIWFCIISTFFISLKSAKFWFKQTYSLPQTLSLHEHLVLFYRCSDCPDVAVHSFITVVLTTAKPHAYSRRRVGQQGETLCVSWFCHFTVTRSHINQPHPVDKGRVQN